MNKISLVDIKNKINNCEIAKNKKRNELKLLYENLSSNEEFLDLLMIQIGKDIESLFPGIKFRLYARIKSRNSFLDKVENDLSEVVEGKGEEDLEKINNIKIYDILALTIIVEDVPNYIALEEDEKKYMQIKVKTKEDKKDKKKILKSIALREETKKELKFHEKKLEEFQNRLKNLEKDRKRKLRLKDKKQKELEELKSELKNIDNSEINYQNRLNKDLKNIREDLKELNKDINNLDININEQLKVDISDAMNQIESKKSILPEQDNNCKHAVAMYIVKNITKFDNVKALELKQIPNRYKEPDKENGYRATHDCFEAERTFKNKEGKEETIKFICELQGKSYDDYIEADRGLAASYHISQKNEPGKKSKQKVLTDLREINTPEEIEKFRQDFKKKVPVYKIYSNHSKNRRVYTLSNKESFLLYYHNLLMGNEVLNIKPEKEILNELNVTEKLSSDNGKFYNGSSLEYER